MFRGGGGGKKSLFCRPRPFGLGLFGLPKSAQITHVPSYASEKKIFHPLCDDALRKAKDLDIGPAQRAPFWNPPSKILGGLFGPPSREKILQLPQRSQEFLSIAKTFSNSLPFVPSIVPPNLPPVILLIILPVLLGVLCSCAGAHKLLCCPTRYEHTLLSVVCVGSATPLAAPWLSLRSSKSWSRASGAMHHYDSLDMGPVSQLKALRPQLCVQIFEVSGAGPAITFKTQLASSGIPPHRLMVEE